MRSCGDVFGIKRLVTQKVIGVCVGDEDFCDALSGISLYGATHLLAVAARGAGIDNHGTSIGLYKSGIDDVAAVVARKVLTTPLKYVDTLGDLPGLESVIEVRRGHQ